MFISEERLLELQNDKTGKYFGKQMAEIFLSEVHLVNNFSLSKFPYYVKGFYCQDMIDFFIVVFPDFSVIYFNSISFGIAERAI